MTPLAEFLMELWMFVRARKKYWLVPIFVMTIILGGLVVVGQSSTLGQFVYTLF